ncbi:methylamine utilization protein [Sphingomonas immobilis]|uniref:Methylamine utilization protein n=1 Tax=Sphingomonas immobilis TaxID=3063997 RepID=A0ABT8ZWG3_9SPHN|nr:methylamine utilization protein [Sphingomonas sp. CA1-15]MDO7841901.1 methylamine utilization protein [Sphingomonas sp. CA1-15]
MKLCSPLAAKAMIMRVLIACSAVVFATLSAAPGVGATVNIDVRDASGQPMPNAVVLIDSPHKPAGPIKFPWPYEIAQQNIMFMPHILIVPVGASVSFPNRDKVRHHVYSFSPAKKFDLKLYGKEDARSVTFDKPGVVSLGCNIHDSMSAFVFVVDTPYAMITDASGHVTIPNVPAGAATVRLWNPAIRTTGNMLSQTITVPAGGLSATYSVRGK